MTAVDDISFTVKDGEIFGFLGPNGAGKTTTIRMLTGLISKTSGEIRINKLDISNEKDSIKIRRMIGLLPENPGLYEKLSVYRNLEFYADLYGMSKAEKKEKIEQYLKMLGLWERRNEEVGGFSKGMKQKVAIARALLHEPKYLFLDEPTAGLDPEAAKTVRDFILKIKKNRVIFLNTHNLYEAQRICDRIGIIKQKLLVIDSPEKLEKSLYKPETIIQLDEISKNILRAVKKLVGVKKVIARKKQLIIKIDKEERNPDIVKAIVRAGGRIQSVESKKRSLEDVYLKMVGKNES
jgi:ABC-2 type transport system ATP-binding protein